MEKYSKFCFNKDGLCEEDYCRCNVTVAQEEQILRKAASNGRKWAMWRLLKDFGEDGDGLMPFVGQAPR